MCPLVFTPGWVGHAFHRFQVGPLLARGRGPLACCCEMEQRALGSTLSAEGFVQHQSTFQPVPQSWAKPQGSAHSSSRSPPDTGTPGAVTACVEAADAECQGVVWPHSVTLGRVGPLWASFPTSLGTGLGSQGPTPHTYISMTL